jgi:hypothetical protein
MAMMAAAACMSIVTTVSAARGVSARSRASAASSCEWNLLLNSSAGLGLDSGANYYVGVIQPVAGETQVFHGQFPKARYFSYTDYLYIRDLEFGMTVPDDHIHDAQIKPSSGVNRFLPGQTANGTYSVTVVDGKPPAVIPPNTIYTDNTGSVTMYVMYRIYDSSVASDPLGGVPLPSETTYLNGHAISQGLPCVTPFNGTLAHPGMAGAAAPARGAAHARGESPARILAPARPAATSSVPWTLPTATAAQAQFSNPDISYLGATYPTTDGQVAVVRIKTTSFPNTNAGSPVWQTGAQVRYWSLCIDNGFFTFVTGCVDDYAAIQSGGEATFAFSSPAERPTNATAAAGVNWMSLGSGLWHTIVYRQMLAATSFTQSIAAIPADGSPATTMGPYYPQLAFCTVSTFESSGPSGCLGSSAAVRTAR